MRKKKNKLKILSRSEETIRRNSVYEYYNKLALPKLKEGISLTSFKEEIAQKFFYKSYQAVANIITKEDSKRRAELSDWLLLLTKELFIDLPTTTNKESQKQIRIKKNRYAVDICVTVRYEQVGDDFSLTYKEVTLLNAFHNSKSMYLIEKDRNMILDYLNKRIIFDIVPPEQE